MKTNVRISVIKWKQSPVFNHLLPILFYIFCLAVYIIGIILFIPSSVVMAREPKVQVLHFSMPRTGSFSMKAAYEELGMPTYHGFVYIERPKDQLRWFDAVDAKYYGKGNLFGPEEFNELLGEWAVVSDNPAIGFVEELIATYSEVSKTPIPLSVLDD